jgi:uncharacterized protein
MIRAVLDTNVLISAYLNDKGASRKIVEAAAKSQFRLITCSGILREIVQVLHYPHIQKRYNPDEKGIIHFVANLAVLAEITPGSLIVQLVEEDPADDMVIASALEGRASFIVSGDAHLKSLGSYEGVKIITPKEFLAIMERDTDIE